VTVVDTGLNTMTGGRIKRIQPYIGNERFLMTYGDGVCDVDIAKLVEFHKQHGKIATLTAVMLEQQKGVLDIGRRWRYSGAGGVLNGIARMVYYGCPVNPKCGNCFSFSSIQRSNTYDCAKRGTYKMRWLHADHASSKCDYQSSCRSVFICCLAS